MAFLLQQLLAASAERTPEAVAVRARGRDLTYAELDARSSQLAHLLRERGVTRGDRVGLCFPKAVESVVAMLGVLKAGAAYVPLDPQAPAQRVAGIAADCGLRAVITTAERLATLAPAGLACAVLVSGQARAEHEVEWSALDALPTSAPPEESIETDLAYILYTSGSTGRPKGVMLTH